MPPGAVSGLCGGGGGRCTVCRCAAPDTPIATPSGEAPIADIRIGDLVYSVHEGALLAVPVISTNRVEVRAHKVVRVALDTGAILRISPAHPTADGRNFADLRESDELGGARIVGIEWVDYLDAYTYDILPASDTGTYVAGGALVGSTLFAAPTGDEGHPREPERRQGAARCDGRGSLEGR